MYEHPSACIQRQRLFSLRTVANCDHFSTPRNNRAYLQFAMGATTKK